MGLFEAIHTSATNLIDQDHDGAVLDNIVGGGTEFGMDLAGTLAGAIGGAPGGLPGMALGAKAGSGFAGAASGYVGDAAHAWGDEMTDFLGTRDQSASNAGGHGDGIGGEARNAINPGGVADTMAHLGTTVGMFGGPLMATSLGVQGMLAGRGIEAVRDSETVAAARDAVSHWLE
jgi:hypothetical protein